MAGWEEELGLDNVRPFDRPMTAGKNDKVVGQDELGQTIYETPTGQRYTVRPATKEESKTTRAKVENWVDEGSPLPSWDQIAEAAKNAPVAAYNSVANMVRGEGTYGDVMGAVATMAAPGATKAFDAFDPNTTRMFFGPNSPEADIAQFNRAKTMSENGYSPEEVWLSTGWWNSPNGWRFEVDDSQVELHPNFIKKAEEVSPLGNLAVGYIEDAVSHPAFFDAIDRSHINPTNSKIRAKIEQEVSGSYGVGRGDLIIKGPTKNKLKSVLLHEMQHLVQDAEGNNSIGANPDAIANNLQKTLEQMPREALEYLAEKRERDKLISQLSVERLELESRLKEEPEIETDPSLMADYTFLKDHYTETITDLKRDRNEKAQNFQRQFSPEFKKSLDDFYTATLGFTDYLMKTDDGGWQRLTRDQATEVLRRGPAFDLYRRDPGEVEARLVQTRKDLTPAERAVRFPGDDLDVDPKTMLDKYDLNKLTNNMLIEFDNLRNKRRYATGGMVENPNMDPVSGNPVPAGAKPEEVRDDVPIMASEGEYVIPANVVRFLGLDRIERMVSQAKEKLQEMEDKGRIGGQTEEDLPFSAEELLTLDESQPQAPVPQMATGGMVQDPNNDVDPSTGLPRWLVSLQNAPTASPAIPQAPQAAPAPNNVQPQTPQVKERTGDRFKVEQENNKLTGMAQAVRDWTPKEFNQYARARNSVDQKVGQALASVIPLGGLMARARERHLERAVPREIDNMLKSGRDLQGNPLTEEQKNELRQTRQTIGSERLSQAGGFTGAVQAIARESGILPRREARTPAKPETKPASETSSRRSAPPSRPAPRPTRSTKENKPSRKGSNTAR